MFLFQMYVNRYSQKKSGFSRIEPFQQEKASGRNKRVSWLIRKVSRNFQNLPSFFKIFFQMKQDDLKKVNQLHKNFKKQDKLQSFFKKRLKRLKRQSQPRIDFGGEISSLGGRYVTKGVFPIFR